MRYHLVACFFVFLVTSTLNQAFQVVFLRLFSTCQASAPLVGKSVTQMKTNRQYDIMFLRLFFNSCMLHAYTSHWVIERIEDE